MKLKFTKMHGAGNDFVVLDGTRAAIVLSSAQLRQLADRHLGIGADQILVVESSRSPEVDFSYRIFNADGAEVEQCGNGARAFVKFVREQGLSDQSKIRVETMSGVIEPCLESDGRVTVDMGKPVFQPERVPFITTGLSSKRTQRNTIWSLELEQQAFELSVLSMGNPHAVLQVNNIETAPVTSLGPSIEHHHRFPKRVNVGFMQINNRHEIQLRVWERGAGETLACGTGACAAVVSGLLQGQLETPVTVHARGGDLSIAWSGEDQSVMLTGPAQTVFTGEIEI